MEKPHILADAAEIGFCNLKSKFPLNVKKNTSSSMRKEDLSIDNTFDPCQFSLDTTLILGKK
jgi:hypothetical protein